MPFETFTEGGRAGAHAQRYALSFSAAACALVGVLIAGQRVRADPPQKDQDPVEVTFVDEVPEEKKPKEEEPLPEPAAAPLVPAMIKASPLPPPPKLEAPPDTIPDKAPEADPAKDPGAAGGGGDPAGTGTGGAGGGKSKPAVEAKAPSPPPPPPPPPPKTLVAEKPAEGDVPPKPLSAPKPAYPDAARAAGIQGVVVVKITIDEKGTVTSAKIIKGDPNFEDVVMRTVLGWKFEPARHPDGTAFASTKTLKFPFKLSG